MPSCMIHLGAAAEYNPKMPVRLMIGSVVPDSIKKDFTIKDITHLRNIADEEERMCALKKYALSVDTGDDFFVGVILHLYLDCLWDYTALKDFKELKNNDFDLWFTPYRHEISVASGWLFHHVPWAEKVWTDMLGYDVSQCPCIEHCSHEDLRDYLVHNYTWHSQSGNYPSRVYTPEYVKSFVHNSVRDFNEFLLH